MKLDFLDNDIVGQIPAQFSQLSNLGLLHFFPTKKSNNKLRLHSTIRPGQNPVKVDPRRLIESARLIGDACNSFSENCAMGIKANEPVVKRHLENSLMLVTALNTKIGYYKAAEIAKYAHKNGTTLKEAAVGLGHVTESEYDEIVDPSKMIGH